MAITKRRTPAQPVVFSNLAENAFAAGFQAAQTLSAVVQDSEVEAPVDMEAAASALGAFFEANEEVKELERTKRRAKKLIATLKAGVYGTWKLSWKPSARETPDLEAIARIFRENGLGDVPMKQCSDTMEVSKV